MLSHLSTHPLRALLVLAWLLVLLSTAQPLALILEYGAFTFLGVLGAVFANSTGAGGGVVFVPFFNQLQFDATTTVATSFAIQCFGMTAGALTWWAYYRTQRQRDTDWQAIGSVLTLTVPLSVLGIWSAQIGQNSLGGLTEAKQLHTNFGVFSILLALFIFTSIPLLKKQALCRNLARIDKVSLGLIAFVGGAITAHLSIGVGELIAAFLIIRRFNVTFAIASAVIVSAFSVWAGVVFHVLVTQAVYWPIVLFAGPGAVIGGMCAKYVVLFFSATHLKMFFATWILLLGISTLPY